MTFQVHSLNPDETARLIARVRGPVLSLSKTSAFDPEAEATFISLGGQGWRNPADHEPPSHFNLFWRDQVIALSGYSTVERHGDGNIRHFSLSLSLPQALADQLDQVTRLVKEGLIAYWSSLSPFPSAINVEISEVTCFTCFSPPDVPSGIQALQEESINETPAASMPVRPSVRFVSSDDQQFAPLPVFVTRTNLTQLLAAEPSDEPAPMPSPPAQDRER